ncbi:DUF1893 domain-containing protein [Tissierella sp. Yu-01]|uniref:DUF1893 domain-containing protein n=1 Tax=Tissierella sp. Yu-01 TaxID=3035694 RepID=UPI00240D5DEA|nr:DUF1893 domain-containing protein [Tissierella sp. Yu-01]WFA09371.1 DUF1893 domain-containing protein [Tissierella sp. Yu-01]
MRNLDIAKEYLLKNDLNFVIVKDGQVIEESSSRGIKPIYETYKNNVKYFEGASVADRVIGKAAAMFLVSGGIKELYTDLISELAIEILENDDIVVNYSKKVPMILNRAQDDMCPIEKLSSQTNDVYKLVEEISNFLNNIKVN